MKIERILFPTDFGESADVALLHALFYAEHYNAELHVLHSISWHEPESIMASMKRSALKMLDDALERHAGDDGHGFHVTKRTIVGNATPKNILSYAEEHDINLIVMGTHGRGLRHLFIGSVSEEVARLARCPVITVRAGADRNQPGPKHILVPFDFCPQSGAALLHARYLAAHFEAKITVCHVVQEYYYTSELSSATVSLRELVPDLEAQQQGIMEACAKNTGGPEVPTAYHVEIGSPVTSITRWVDEHDCDLVVMGTHGRGGLGHLILGSTTERVIRLANCPVYTLKVKTEPIDE